MLVARYVKCQFIARITLLYGFFYNEIIFIKIYRFAILQMLDF
jgi:hypothetical protein